MVCDAAGGGRVGCMIGRRSRTCPRRPGEDPGDRCDVPTMTVLRSVVLFVVAALVEIGGAWLGVVIERTEETYDSLVRAAQQVHERPRSAEDHPSHWMPSRGRYLDTPPHADVDVDDPNPVSSGRSDVSIDAPKKVAFMSTYPSDRATVTEDDVVTRP